MIVQEAKEEKKKRRLKKGLVVFVSGSFVLSPTSFSCPCIVTEPTRSLF